MSKTAKIKEQNIRPEPLMAKFRELCKLDAESFLNRNKCNTLVAPVVALTLVMRQIS